jgi:uncharacterized repeat protein (TIGR03803 family)
MRSDMFLSALHLAVRLSIFFVLVAGVLLIAPYHAQAQTFTVLYSFKGTPDSAGPSGGLALDASGNIYGTSYAGGASYHGTAFKLTPAGKETVLYSFLAGYGANPTSKLARDAKGTLYGTTLKGGVYNAGTVFRLNKKGDEAVLHSFLKGGLGYSANGVILDGQGTLFGTTYGGGNSGCFENGCGVVFKLDAAGKETVLYSFTGGTDGGAPSSIVRDPAGNLYGTTVGGGDLTCNSGYGCGTVFKLDTAGKETVLYSFTGTGGDGAFPYSGVVRDSAGALYGSTGGGGNQNCGYPGCGTVFKVEANGKETVLHRFTGTGGDGRNPTFASLVLDAAGNIYGTTQNGGDASCDCGVVFMLDTSAKETILHTFSGGADGAAPNVGLVLNAAGDIYGAAASGGDLDCNNFKGNGCGTIFKLTP